MLMDGGHLFGFWSADDGANCRSSGSTASDNLIIVKKEIKQKLLSDRKAIKTRNLLGN